MELNKENLKKIRGVIVFTALLVICLWKYTIVFECLQFIFHVFLPFILGGAIAFVLSVPMNFIQRHLFAPDRIKGHKRLGKMARPVSLVLTIIFVFGIIATILFIVVPQLGSTFASLGDTIQAFVPRAQEWVEKVFHDNKEIMVWVNQFEFDWDKVMSFVVDFFKNGAGNMLDSTIYMAKSIISAVTTFFIAFVFSCYVLLQKERLRVQVKKVMFAFIPKGKAEAALEVFTLTYHTFSSFLTGQCVEAVILGSMFVVVMTIFRLPYALLIGIVIAFTALIPVFGAFIGCVIGAFLIFMVDPVKALLFLAVFLVLQQVEGNLIYPHVVGGSVGLPSIWVLAAVSIGASLMGVVGMLIFIPLVSVLYALFREVVYLKLRQQGIDPGEID